jgi:hypothetical protein
LNRKQRRRRSIRTVFAARTVQHKVGHLLRQVQRARMADAEAQAPVVCVPSAAAMSFSPLWPPAEPPSSGARCRHQVQLVAPTSTSAVILKKQAQRRPTGRSGS